MTDELSPLGQLAEKVRYMNDREKLLLIDWLVDALDDEAYVEVMGDGLFSAMEIAEGYHPGPLALEYPPRQFNGWSREAWATFREARNAALNYRLGEVR